MRESEIALYQEAYNNMLIEIFGLNEAHLARILLVNIQHHVLRSKQPSTEDEKADMDDLPYRELVGSLFCVSTRARPDISVARGILARRVEDPRIVD